MRLVLPTVTLAFSLLAACGSSTTTGSGGSGATGSSTTTGSGGATGSGGSGGATTSSSGSTSASSSGAGGGCVGIDASFAAVLAKPLSGCGGFEPPCHSFGAGSFTLDPSNAAAAWAAMVNTTAATPGAGKLVAPGDPAHSFVYRKLTNDLTPDEGGPMPAPGNLMGAMWTELPQDELDTLRCWILGGAPKQ